MLHVITHVTSELASELAEIYNNNLCMALHAHRVRIGNIGKIEI